MRGGCVEGLKYYNYSAAATRGIETHRIDFDSLRTVRFQKETHRHDLESPPTYIHAHHTASRKHHILTIERQTISP
jgi:hypothetical protein